MNDKSVINFINNYIGERKNKQSDQIEAKIGRDLKKIFNVHKALKPESFEKTHSYDRRAVWKIEHPVDLRVYYNKTKQNMEIANIGASKMGELPLEDMKDWKSIRKIFQESVKRAKSKAMRQQMPEEIKQTFKENLHNFIDKRV